MTYTARIEALAAAAAANTAAAFAVAFADHYPYTPFTLHDPATSDWYGDGQTWALTADADWTLDSWVISDNITPAALRHRVWVDAFDSGALVIGPDTTPA